MRSAFVTDIIRSVRGSLGRFLAIMGIVALGCGFYAGLQMCGPDMRADADRLYDGTNLWDIRLISTLGFGDDDVERVRAVEGVEHVMPSVTCDAMARLGTEQVAVRITSLDPSYATAGKDAGPYEVASEEGDYLNRPHLVDGRWPKRRGECVVSADVPRADYGVGDTIELLYGASDLDDLLRVKELTIVGTVSSSNYVYTGSFGSTNLGGGMIDQYIYVAPRSLAKDTPYTEIYLTVSGAADELSESAAYRDVVDATKGRLEDLEAELASERQADVKAKAQETLDEKWDTYNKEKKRADKKLADSQKELDDAAKKLKKGARELKKGEAEYADGLSEYEKQRDATYAKLDAAADEIERNQELLDEKQAEYEAGRQRIAAGRRSYEQGLKEFLSKMGAKSLADTKKTLEGNLSQVNEGIKQLEAGIAQIEGAPAEAQSGIEAAQAGITAAEEAIAQAQAGIDEADATFATLEGQREATAAQVDSLATQKTQLEAALETAGEEERPTLEAQLAEVEAGLTQAQEALGQIDVGIAQAQAGREQATQGKAQAEAGLAEAQAGLEQAQAGLAEAGAAQEQLPGLKGQLTELKGQKAQVEEGLSGVAKLEASKAELDRGQAELDAGHAQLKDGQAKIDAGRAELADGRATAERELAAAKATLDAGAAELEDARQELKDGRADYKKGKRAFEKARKKADRTFAKSLRQLEDAQNDIDTIELPDIYALDRTQSEGAATYHADADRIDSIAAVFPFIFFLVAALVSLTTMTRMVEDDRVQIGTYKALGYGTGAIAAKYLAYAGIAGVVGAVVGIVVLSQVLPYIVMSAYSIIYTVPIHPFPLPINLPIALSAGGLGVGVTLLATWGAVISSLREVPATLMLPRAPKAGKRILLERITPLWSRLSFTWKVTCRNLFRYKRRFLMTVIGISGCTALLLVGFGLHDSIWDIIDCQYGPIIHFDTTIGLDDSAIELDVQRVCDYLDETGEVSGIVRVQNENMQASSEDATETLRVNVVVPRKTDQMATVITFRNRRTYEALALDEDAVIVTEKIALKYGLQEGSTLVLYDQDDVGNAVGSGHALTITGVAENYVGNLVYVGKNAWAEVSDKEPVYSTIYATTTADEAIRKDITDDLHAFEDVSTVIFSDETINMYRKMLSVVDMIVVVLIVSAAALAYIVLYNLTNINIGERIREIASLKVLGFTRGEVYAYIFREIALLAVMGDAVGMILGIFLERFVVTTAEVDYVMFGRTIHPPSFAYAFALTLLFTGLVIFTMRHKLDRVDMVESLKSVD